MKKIMTLFLTLFVFSAGLPSAVSAAGETSITGSEIGAVFNFSNAAVDIVHWQPEENTLAYTVYELPVGTVITVDYPEDLGLEGTGMQVCVYDSSDNSDKGAYGLFSYTVTEEYAHITTNTKPYDEIYVHGVEAEESSAEEAVTEDDENDKASDSEDNSCIFTDIASSDYYYDAVIWAVNNKITTGTSAVTFSPDEICTRGQIITFLWRASGSEEPAYTGAFTDVSEEDYYFKAVQWAHEQGVITSSAAGAFYPEQPCTRATAVEFLWRLAGSPALFSDADFEDVPKGSEYEEAVAWAVSEGITAGTSDKAFSPDTPCTRAQIVTFLYRAAA
ncbi:MAG: S-layer homology domain-containing protein [Clostridiales bacterium]|nr:S-layer homology domain-containing protein [Clostridiales bacterium]